MSWLSSLAGSVASSVINASASALSGSNNVPGLPAYSLGDKVYEFDRRSIWTLWHGTKKDDQTPVTVFSFDLHAQPQPQQQGGYGGSFGAGSSPNDRKSQLQLAKNALRKLRALRHPHILKFLDGVDTDATVWIVTEPVRSLSLELDSTGPPIAEESKVFGLLHLVTALGFLNKEGASIHGNVRPESVWISAGGEWKLAGMELTTRKDDDAGVIWNFAGLIPDARTFASPEVRRGGWTALKEHDASALDAYALYLLIFVIFNGSLPPTFSSSSDSPPTLPGTRGSIPQSFYNTWRRLGNPNARARLRTDVFLELGMGSESTGGGWWPQNRLVKLSAALEGFSLASDVEKASLLKMLKDVSEPSAGTKRIVADPLPDGFLKYKVLPSLVRTFEFGGGGPALLPVILNLASGLAEQEYSASIIQPLVRMFATPDRAMRMALLEGLDKFADKLTNKDVTEKVWPHLLTGFGDVVPIIREATVKSILLIAPKLSERILNNDLLRLLARTQTDPEPGIRTNTCILLGRLSRHLQPSTNRKVLVPAFARALRDPFIHARIAGLMALMATADVYEKEDLAGKVIPAMSICLIDREKAVRDQGYKAIDLFVKKCEQLTANMPETAPTTDENGNSVIPGAAGATNSAMAMNAASSTQPGLATNAAGAAGALAGWAFASVSKKLSTAEAAAPIERRPSTPATSSESGSPNLGGISTVPSASNGHVKRSSMQLGRASSSSSSRPFQSSSLAMAPGGFDDDAEEEDEEEEEGPEDWGQDLMDVNADEDDWDQFESGNASAPPKIDPLAARLSASKPKTLKLGGAVKAPGFRVPNDLEGADLWDLDHSSSPKKPIVSASTVRKPPPDLMASAVPAGPKQVVTLAPRPPRVVAAPIIASPKKHSVPAPTSPVQAAVNRTAGVPIPIKPVRATPMSPPRPIVAAVPAIIKSPPRQLAPTPQPLPPPPAPERLFTPPLRPPSEARSTPPPSSFMSPTSPVARSATPSSIVSRGTSIDESSVSSTTAAAAAVGGDASSGTMMTGMTKEEKMAQAREQRRLRMAQAKAKAGK